MPTTEPAKAPNLFKAAVVFAAAAALVGLSSRAPAQELSPAPHAYAGEPSVRIRGADPRGMSAVAFADWLSARDAARITDGSVVERNDVTASLAKTGRTV